MKNSPKFSDALSAAVKCIEKAEKQGRGEDPDTICLRVADSAYYYKRKIRETKAQLGRFEKLPGRDGMPYAFRALWKHFKKEGFIYKKDTPQAAFKDYDCGSFELDMLKSLIIAAAIIETGLVCEAALEKRGYHVIRLQNAIKLIKTVEVTDFSHVYPLLSESERRLSEREPLYLRMTDSTKALYRKALRRYAKRLKTTEKDAVLKAETVAVKHKLPLGAVLGVDKKPSPVLYLLISFVIFAAVTWAALALCPPLSVPLLVLPLVSFALGGADFIFSFLAAPSVCPAIDPHKLPEGKHTLVVITTLLSDDDDAFDELERLYHTNKSNGILFGILADLPAAKQKNVPADAQLIKKATANLESLKYRFGNNFCLFIRARSYDGEGGFCGKERKRGAIEELVAYLRGKGNSFSLAEGADSRGVRFLLTLDGDTKLPPQGAAVLTGMMLHPLNRPHLYKKRRGYGIIQPAVKPCLPTAGGTLFSAMLTGVGGIDVYESAAFNRQQTVFGEGIFCGKGIIDIEAYGKHLSGVLPPNRVLSHDMPEGNILRTRYVSQLSFTDSVPKGVFPYFSRLHRWIRGDVQNLLLLSGYKQGVRGSLRILMNVFRHLSPVVSLTVLLLAGLFYQGKSGLWLCFFSLINLLSPIFYTVISRPAALKYLRRRFFSSVQSGVIHSLQTVFFELSSLSHKAVVTADAIIRAFFRMARGKKMLSWVTSAQREKQKDGGIALYIYRCFPSVLIGALAFFATGLWITRLLGLIWFLFPVFAFRLSCPVKEKNSVTPEMRRSIKARAKEIWQFFAENVNETTDWLPPDNVQFSPVEATARRTSPTNVGLYLLSVAAAEDFGFISESDAERRIDKALQTVEQLPKWRGHLYNWYSLAPCKAIGGNYVSTVDSGNLCVCLVILARFLYSEGKTGLARRAEQLYTNADFKSLYNSDRNLFALGANGETGDLSDICYDLYMSEARSTSYFALAMGQVPIKHWRALGRPVVGNGGHIGMASWSGTAFEFFMPQLFLPLYKNSFVYESLCFALWEQRRFSKGHAWGCSESAFFAFDGEMNYQYKAHGVQSLALTRYEESNMVLSPYSAYLTLCIAPKESLKALSAFEKMGMQGKYGLYEAIDFTTPAKNGAVITSYMAHHMGMSLIACANACFDSVFVKRFMNHPAMASFYELLQEKIPTGALIYDAEKQRLGKGNSRSVNAAEQRVTDSSVPSFFAMGKGINTIVADSMGHVRFSYGNNTVNETHFDRYSHTKSLNVCFCVGKERYYATPTEGQGKYTFECGAGYAAHICASPEFSGRVKYYTDPAGSFITETQSDGGKSYSVVFSFDPQLASDKEFYAHPAFNRLFISAEYDKGLNALIYTKNSRDGKDTQFMAVGLADAAVPISYETNKESYGAFSLHNPADVIKERYTESTGVCVTPLCLIKTPPLAGGAAKLVVSLGHTRKECCERLSATRRMGGKSVGISVFGEGENPVLEGIFCGRRKFMQSTAVKESALWSFGVSGDYPIIAVLLREDNDRDAEFFLNLFKNLTLMNIRTELVLMLCEEDSYRAALRNGISRLMHRLKCQNFVGKRGGIFFADGNDKNTVALFKDAAVYYTESFDSPFLEQKENGLHLSLPPIIRRHTSHGEAEGTQVCGGAYGENFFAVEKDKAPALPFSYVLAGESFGSVVTQSTLGYSFYKNSALCRIGAFSADPYGGTDKGEELYAFINGKIYDLTACAGVVRYEDGVACYKGAVADIAYTFEIFVCAKLPLKVIKIVSAAELETAFSVAPVMGSAALPSSGVKTEPLVFKAGAGVAFTNPKNSFFEGAYGFVATVGQGTVYNSRSTLLQGEKGVEDIAAVKAKGTSTVYLVGAASSLTAAEDVCDRFANNGADVEKSACRLFAKGLLPPVKLLGKNSFAAMFNCFAPYQVAACRFYGRGAFYQSGGAYGFRDQLQDSMFLLYSQPHAVRRHLLLAASRQYTDGSVQHWWHPTEAGKPVYGVKTKCSDDFLWLPLAVAEYVEKTGDRTVLSENVPYLQSPPLGNEQERYECAETTDYAETLEAHCRRALDYGKSYGAHGLPLMGNCDWNDAFSAMGEGAESVFCAFLQVIALKKFSELVDDPMLKQQAYSVLERAERAYETDRYIRAYTGGGAPVGVDGRGACEIDALVQAFAVFAGADSQKAKLGVKTAYQRLYDKENRLLRLFTPPFGRDTEYAGYINAYTKGVRENGGQYTHAAVWFSAALALCGMTEEAKQLISDINPLNRSENSTLYAKYKGEPYAIAADIYTAKGREGRMGWSHYTGAAAWYCKTVLEVFMGIKLKNGTVLDTVKPIIEYEATLGFVGKLTVKAYKNAPLSYDGKPASFPLQMEEGEHILTVPLI